MTFLPPRFMIALFGGLFFALSVVFSASVFPTI